jgi:hypothetical protein
VAVKLTRFQRDYRWYRRKIRRVVTLVVSCTGGLHVDATDHVRFVTHAYALMQNEHARSVLALGKSPSLGLVVRCMAEGAGQLDWIFGKDKKAGEYRAELWRAYSIIVDWQNGARDPAKYPMNSPQWKRMHEEFFTRDARRAKSHGQALPPEPYRRQWLTPNVSDVLGISKGGKQMYESVYRKGSDLAHWNVNLFSPQLEHLGRKVLWRSVNEFEVHGYLIAALWSLLAVATRADHVFKFGHLHDLRPMMDQVEARYLEKEAADYYGYDVDAERAEREAALRTGANRVSTS